MGRYVVAFIVILLMVLAVIPAQAYDYNSPEYWDIREELRLEQYAARERMEALAEELKADSSWEWSHWLLECYYRSVVDYLYTAQRNSVFAQQVDYTLVSKQLAQQGRYWPKDPLNDWQLLPVQDIGDDPLPGGIVMQCCPPERYSDIYRNCYPRPRSFEISIYAPQGLEPQRVRPRAGNRCWAESRPEMLAMRGWFEPPYTVIDDPAFDLVAARESVDRIGWQRELALGWFREYYPEPPAGRNTRLEFCLQRMATVLVMDEELTGLEMKYTGVHPGFWEEEDRETWLFDMIYTVYSASLACAWFEGAGWNCEFDLRVLVDGGFLPRVPPNPFQSGRPLRILTPGDGFSPGDLCLMYPTSYWAGTGTRGVQSVMYQLFIYGDDPGAEPDPVLEGRLTFNDGTFHVPRGAIQTVNTYTSGYLLNSDYRQAMCDG